MRASTSLRPSRASVAGRTDRHRPARPPRADKCVPPAGSGSKRSGPDPPGERHVLDPVEHDAYPLADRDGRRVDLVDLTVAGRDEVADVADRRRFVELDDDGVVR